MVKNDWDSKLYTDKHAYVFKFGEDVVKLLDPRPGELILDLGSGTGYLTNLIADAGAVVIGIDNSSEMVEQAKQKYPELDFYKLDATDFNFKEKFNAVFSNAVLHWISESEKVVNCVAGCLKKGGRFVAEFGGKNNITLIVNSLKKVLLSNGYSENIKRINWYFPSVGEYSSLLEKYGFRVTFASHFDRDTFLDEGLDIIDWLEMFAKSFFMGIDPGKRNEMLKLIKADLIATNCKDGKWFMDYKRLRIAAVKE
jgi:trans-aconitate methyltransferase